MTVEIGDVLKLVASVSMPGNWTAQNVFYVKLGGTSPITDAEAESEAVSYVEAIYDTMDGEISQDCSLDDLTIHKYVPDPGVGWETGDYVGVANLTDNFTGVIQMLPHAVAAVVTGFVSDVKVRSRKSFAGFAEDQQDDSLWVAGALTALANAAAAWIADWTWIGTEYFDPGVPLQDGSWLPLIATLVGAVAGSQRRRKPGVGI